MKCLCCFESFRHHICIHPQTIQYEIFKSGAIQVLHFKCWKILVFLLIKMLRLFQEKISSIIRIFREISFFGLNFELFSNSPIPLLERTVSKPHLKAMFRLDWWLIETAVQTTSNIDRKLASLFRISWGHQSVQFLVIFQHFRNQLIFRLRDFKYLQLHNHHLNRRHQRTSNGLTLYSNCFLDKMYFKNIFPY